MKLGSAFGESFFDGVNTGQFFIFHFDSSKSFIYESLALCSNHCHAVACVTNGIGKIHVAAVGSTFIGHIGSNNNCFYAFDCLCLFGVDGNNTGAGIGAAQHTCIQHIFHVDISCIASLAGNLFDAFHTRMRTVDYIEFLLTIQWHNQFLLCQFFLSCCFKKLASSRVREKNGPDNLFRKCCQTRFKP